MIPSVVISRLHCGKSLRRGYEIRRRARGASPLFILAFNFELFTSFSPTFPELSPLLSAVSALFGTRQNSTFLFSITSALSAPKHPGWGYLPPLQGEPK